MEVREPSANYLAKLGYKQTEVGLIPEDWGYSEIGAFIDLLTGFPFPSKGYVPSGIRLLRGSNIKRGNTDWSDDQTAYWPSVSTDIRKYALGVGDIVVAMDGSLVGRSFASLSAADIPSLLLQRVARIRSSSVVQAYLRTWICSSRFTEHCDAVKTTTAIPHISPADIRSFKVAIPPSGAEQQTIAEALSDADALIESLDQLLAKKRQIKQGAMQELLTGQKRLPGFSGEWAEKAMGELFDFSGGYSASRDQLGTEGHCYLHYGDIHTSDKTSVDLTAEHQELPKLDVPLMKVGAGSLLRDGDVVFVDASEDDEGTSKHVVVANPDNVPFISGLHTIVARSKDSELVNLYKRFCFQTRAVKSQFRFFAVGTKVSGVSKSNIGKITVMVPPEDEQTAIATVLSDMDAEIAALEARLAKARLLKQGMMEELLTGRIRLI